MNCGLCVEAPSGETFGCVGGDGGDLGPNSAPGTDVDLQMVLEVKTVVGSL